MTLNELLDLHIQGVKLLARIVEPGEDVAPILGVWRDEELLGTAIVELPAEPEGRWTQHLRAMELLKAKGATAYTMVLNCWTSGKALSREEFEEWRRSGQNVSEGEDRAETIICIAGDRSQTLSAEFDIVRSQSGRIDHLKLRQDWDGIKTGIFYDLMLRPTKTELH